MAFDQTCALLLLLLVYFKLEPPTKRLDKSVYEKGVPMARTRMGDIAITLCEVHELGLDRNRA